ncbi:MAG: ABC transporter ATP-binding protein/permease [Pseudomonadales bacterium]|nr:ABC transporter ATP-binding protein/permease [Pseudomonadales bacterium]
MFKSLFRLRLFIRPYNGRLTLGIFAFLIARIFEGIVPIFMMMGIDKIGAGEVDLLIPVLGIIGGVLGRFIVVSFARLSVRRVALNIAYDLRQNFYTQLQDQGASFFNRYSIGDLMTRAVADISLIQRFISMGTILLVILVFATVVGFGFMLSLSPQLTMMILPPLPLVFFYAWYSSRRMGITSATVQNRLSDIGTHVQENLSGIRTIQAMTQEDNEIARFSKINNEYAEAFYEQSKINSLMTAWMPSFAAVSIIIILGVGGGMVKDGSLSVGAFAAFFMYVNMVIQPFRVAGFMVNLFQRAAIASNRLFEIFDLPPEIKDQPTGLSPDKILGQIDFRNLSYRYPDSSVQILNNINLSISRGESITIMGRVGAGKTTLLKLIIRLLDPPNNQIFVDNFDVHDYPLAQLRSQIAYVPQDAFLFGEPLEQNLSYDDANRPIEQIWEAADSAYLKKTIENFPDQMQTIVGERGVTLSGGQKQRATLARGLIRNASVLILDDCFSSVDTQTEDHILSELKRLRKNQTTILVSHRVSTARHSDRIIVLSEGQIVETGSHEELIQQAGYYAELEKVQREGDSKNAGSHMESLRE